MGNIVISKGCVVGIILLFVISGMFPALSLCNDKVNNLSKSDNTLITRMGQIETGHTYQSVLIKKLDNECDSTKNYLKISQCIDASSDGERIDACFGYAIPLICGDNLPYTSSQQNIANLINDLLRMNVSVFWALTNFSVLTIRFSDNSLAHKWFEKGTFIVPFSGNLSQDALLSVIINDYAYESEIESRSAVDIYYLIEPIVLDILPLHYAKVAYHFGAAVGSYLLLCYLDTLQQGGFLDNQILLDSDIATSLNNQDFNVFIWPGANLAKSLLAWKETTKTNLHTDAMNQIRIFVANGGGYVGSCYGKNAASSGSRLINKFAHYSLDFPVSGRLALLLSGGLSIPSAGTSTDRIVNMSHPVSFGLSQIQRCFYGYGPIDRWYGQNTQPLATLDNFTFQWQGSDFKIFKRFFTECLIEIKLGKPIWLTGNFFDGKIVVFGDHPEIPEPYPLDRLIHNAVFFTSAGTNTSIELAKNLSIQTLSSFNNATSNLTLTTSDHIFLTLWEKIESLSLLCNKIDTTENKIVNLVLELIEEQKIDLHLGNKIATEYRDSYQRWLSGFRDALSQMEAIWNQVNSTIDFSMNITSWEHEQNDTLDTCEIICRNALEMSETMLQKLTVFTGEKLDRLCIQLLAEKRDATFRKGSKTFIKPWMSTVSFYRRIWYLYERELALLMKGEHLLPSTIKRENVGTIASRSIGYIVVDDDAPPNGNGNTEHPYRCIQDAIDAASDGDTIFVHQGIYKEILTIHNRVTLIGENKENTIIDGIQKPHHIVTTTVPNVEITGFTIQNSSKELISGGMLLQESNNFIHDNIFLDNRLGLGLRPMVSNNRIENNSFMYNKNTGLGIDEPDSVNNTVRNNTFIENNQQGLYLVNTRNSIIHNTFVNDSITIQQTNKPLELIIKNNHVNGKPIYCLKNTTNIIIQKDAGEIILSNCDNITIDDITITNIDTAILIILSTNITIMNCHIMHNLVGINMQYTDDSTIQDNTITNNSWSGVWGLQLNTIQIHRNTITSNDDGVLLDASTNIDIQNNSITSNIIGITFMDYSRNNLVEQNNFIDNIYHILDFCHNRYDKNYWDDWIGLHRPLLSVFPKAIKQGSRLIRWYTFDFHPAKEPYPLL